MTKLLWEIEKRSLYKLKQEIQELEELLKHLGDQQKQTTEFIKDGREEIKHKYSQLLGGITL